MCFDVNSIEPHIFSNISHKSYRNFLLFAYGDYNASKKQTGGIQGKFNEYSEMASL
jgi:hypothetical protein